LLHVSDCLIRLTINHSIAEMAVAISAAAVFSRIQKNARRQAAGLPACRKILQSEFTCQTTSMIL
jgi:hypothetical protein